MLIKKVFIRNFRSIGEEGLELDFPSGITTFIGENNVGKSSIFQAINMIINLDVQQRIPWAIENWHMSDQNRTIEIVLTILLNDNEILKIIPLFDPLDLSIDSFKKMFSDELIYKVLITTPLNRPESFFILGEFTICNCMGRLGNIEGKRINKSTDWPKTCQNREFKSIQEFLENTIGISASSFLTGRGTDNFSDIEFNFNKNIPEQILELLRDNVLSIEEYREKPKEERNSSIASSTGIELASILFNLRNGRRDEKSKFKSIKQKFEDIFPNLDLDVIQEDEEIKIYVQKGNIESTTHFLGAGIIQTLLLITHLVAHEDKIILVDHPELFLHPQAERNLASVIDESKNPQILLISHSPYFVSLDRQHTIFRFVQKNYKTVNYKISPDYFTNKEYLKLEHLLDIDSKELFFAQEVLLVEGPTEYGAIPIFAESEGFSFDRNGISIIEVGGKLSLTLFAKLCRGFDIPYLILADNDAKDLLKENEGTVILLSKDFEALLPPEFIDKAKKIVGKSKPRVGKYVAKEMVKSKFEVPKEISDVIFMLRNMEY